MISKNEVLLTSRSCSQVKFTMDDDIEDEAWCDMVPMDACHIFWESHGYI